ncbi:MAG TPA: helix-turn-helix transcriptional regulator [Micromonosporaceae bacterium]|nr:helix-turn-helix transcriptional regulator [Micromonosporaceae bacterium]
MSRGLDPLVAALALRRRALGLTQWGLTRRVRGLPGTANTVSYVESGRHSPTLVTLRRVADALGCDIVLQPRDGAP